MKCLKSKKGAAIDMAIVFMLVTFALCSMLVTVAFASTVRNAHAYNNANEHFSLDQIGEYFIRGLQEKSSVDFMQDVPDGKEDDTNYVRGGWTKFVIDDEETGNPTVYGINIGTVASDYKSNGTYTLRIAAWEQIPIDGKVTDQSAIRLIVTVKKGVLYDGSKTGKATYTIANWSNQPLSSDAPIKDILPSDDPKPQSSWKDYWKEIWKKLLGGDKDWKKPSKRIRSVGKYKRSGHFH